MIVPAHRIRRHVQVPERGCNRLGERAHRSGAL